MEWNGISNSHRTHRKLPLIENTSLNQDQIKTNCVEEFPYLLWRTKRLRRRPNHHNGGNLDPGTSLPIRTQETVPVDLVKTMVDHVFWGSKDTHHLSNYGINKCLALKTRTCLFCNSGALDNRAPEWSQILSWCWWNFLTSANQIAQIGSCDRSRIHVTDLGGTGVWPGK